MEMQQTTIIKTSADFENQSLEVELYSDSYLYSDAQTYSGDVVIFNIDKPNLK